MEGIFSYKEAAEFFNKKVAEGEGDERLLVFTYTKEDVEGVADSFCEPYDDDVVDVMFENLDYCDLGDEVEKYLNADFIYYNSKEE